MSARCTAALCLAGGWMLSGCPEGGCGGDPRVPAVTGACTPLHAGQGSGAYVAGVGSQGGQLGSARPDCSIDLIVRIKSSTTIPDGALGTSVILACGQGGLAATAPALSLSRVSKRELRAELHADAIPACTSSTARASANALGLPFHAAVLYWGLVDGPAWVPGIYEVSASWVYVPFETWDDGPAPPPDAGLRALSFLAPKADSTRKSPVALVVSSTAIPELRLFDGDRELASLSPAPPTTSVSQALASGEHRLRAVGYTLGGRRIAEDARRIYVADPLSLRMTFYYTAYQGDPSYRNDPEEAVLYADDDCTPAYDTAVSRRFYLDACREGTARLTDGLVFNVSRECRCSEALVCSAGKRWCWQRSAHRWGVGSTGEALVPLASWATDPSVIPTGERVYVPAWEGEAIPAMSSGADQLGGFRHDGCFVAADVGSSVVGAHIDLYAGTVEMYRALVSLVPSPILAYRHHPKCP